MKIFATFPVNLGKWLGTKSRAFKPIFWHEIMLSPSIFPKGKKVYGKLAVEFYEEKRGEHGTVRLSYLHQKETWVPIEGSEITTQIGGGQWELAESSWFEFPKVEQPFLIFVEAKTTGGRCSVALFTLFLAHE